MKSIAIGVLAGLSFLSGGRAIAAPPARATTAAAAVEPAVTTSDQAAPDAASQTYILGPADVIEVSVLGRQDFDTKARIGEDGTIRVPYLGTVTAANMTTVQLADALGKALESGGYYTHPIVKVDVASYASRYVTVLGQVNTPGLIPVDRAYRLSEIIARVGGVKESGAAYVVFRPKSGPERHITIEALATGDLKDDPYVSPGDKIYSPEAEMFYVSGQVKSPGVFGLLPNMTLRQAISRAGGLTDSGSLNTVTVTRGGKKLSHLDLDGKVLAGDTILVGERLF